MTLTTKREYNYFQIVLFLSLSIEAAALYADDVKNIYQYKNSEGVTEFTDQVKDDESPVNEIKIPKMSEQEKTHATERLNQIEQENEKLDAWLDAEREQNLQHQKERAQQEKDEEQSIESNDDTEYYNNNIINNRPILPRPRPPIRPKPPINRPIHPRPVPLSLPAR